MDTSVRRPEAFADRNEQARRYGGLGIEVLVYESLVLRLHPLRRSKRLLGRGRQQESLLARPSKIQT
jgi:hypothetical protein